VKGRLSKEIEHVWLGWIDRKNALKQTVQGGDEGKSDDEKKDGDRYGMFFRSRESE